MTTQGSRSVSPRKAISTSPRAFSASSEKFGAGGFQRQRRIGKAEIETLVAAGHRGARRQHHAAAAVEQVDQVVEPLGVAGELLDRAGDREAAAVRYSLCAGREKTVLFM